MNVCQQGCLLPDRNRDLRHLNFGVKTLIETSTYIQLYLPFNIYKNPYHRTTSDLLRSLLASCSQTLRVIFI